MPDVVLIWSCLVSSCLPNFCYKYVLHVVYMYLLAYVYLCTYVCLVRIYTWMLLYEKVQAFSFVQIRGNMYTLVRRGLPLLIFTYLKMSVDLSFGLTLSRARTLSFTDAHTVSNCKRGCSDRSSRLAEGKKQIVLPPLPHHTNTATSRIV